ncbi:sorting nexin-15 isoform X2 [Ambystoma mexicanum]|uniref:sorting nexin-15 isoform X2 n=1 Tax=Ambystoma mexicanum TaxID=8296 RepID=UPI0037E82971
MRSVCLRKSCVLVMSRRGKEEFDRRYQVTGSRLNERGFTEYRVTAEIVVWKRYSDLKKLHGELSYTHRNLFRRMEEFPPFPKAQVFGRFEDSVIEERRRGAEAMLAFTVNIPALSNSPQLKEFFRGGEVKSRTEVLEAVEACGEEVLPPPLIPQSSAIGCLNGQWDEASGGNTEATGDVIQESTVEPVAEGGGTTLAEPNNDVLEEREFEAFGDLKGEILPTDASDDLDLLFDCGVDEPVSPTHCPLSDNELALFDPCYKDESVVLGSFHEEDLASLVVNPEPPDGSQFEKTGQKSLWDQQLNSASDPPEPGLQGKGEYLIQATQQIKLALEKEGVEDFAGAIQSYRDGVDLLLKGVQGDTNATRKEAVKKKMAEYLNHAEGLYQLHLKEAQP